MFGDPLQIALIAMFHISGIACALFSISFLFMAGGINSYVFFLAAVIINLNIKKVIDHLDKEDFWED